MNLRPNTSCVPSLLLTKPRTCPKYSLKRWITSASCSRVHRCVWRSYMGETGLSSNQTEAQLMGRSPTEIQHTSSGTSSPKWRRTSDPSGHHGVQGWPLKTLWGVEPTTSRRHNHQDNMQRRVSPWHCLLTVHAVKATRLLRLQTGDVRCHYALQNKSKTSCSGTDAALMREKRGVFPGVWILALLMYTSKQGCFPHFAAWLQLPRLSAPGRTSVCTYSLSECSCGRYWDMMAGGQRAYRGNATTTWPACQVISMIARAFPAFYGI